jgi:predicted nucleic acid-binding protein
VKDEYFINTKKIVEMGVIIKPVLFETILNSQYVRLQYGLMVNDSLIVASMQEEGIGILAPNDEEFLKVKEITIYKPTDVNI